MSYSSKAQLIGALRNQMTDVSDEKKAARSRNQIEKGIVRIYEYQTRSEQASKDVKLNNGVGFTPADAYILSSFAEQLNRNKNKHLSPRQMEIAYRLMPKYAGQLVEQSIQKGLIQKTKDGYIFVNGNSTPTNNNSTPVKSTPTTEATWTEADERRWIEYKNEYARREAEQEAEAFRAKMEYEMALNRGR